MKTKPKILILYFVKPDRVAVNDLLYCYRRYANARCYYYSMVRGKLPKYLLSIKFDLIVFHTLFISQRWIGLEKFRKTVYPQLEGLRGVKAVKILLPQDEWIHTDALNDFVKEFEVNIVYSVAPETEHEKIYNLVDFKRVKFHKVLTGYLDERTLDRIEKISSKGLLRKIDIGYRAFKAPPWLGRHGYLKTKIAEVFTNEAKMQGLITDISVKPGDTIYGDKWYEFLLSCKYFIGVEGGATVIDRDGKIWDKGIQFSKQNPEASFEEYENACFPGMDGNLGLIAISPRHLEACSTKTCQILIEGHYNGILKSGLHFIEVKSDFSNIDQVMELLKNDELRLEITNRAYNDIVKSGDYGYKKFVSFILDTSLGSIRIGKVSKMDLLIGFLNHVSEALSHLFYFKGDSWYSRKLKLFIYYTKVFPYSLLIKLGLTSYIEKRERVLY